MKKEMYVAPELDILEVMVEQGFAASPTLTPGENDPAMPGFPDPFA